MHVRLPYDIYHVTPAFLARLVRELCKSFKELCKVFKSKVLYLLSCYFSKVVYRDEEAILKNTYWDYYPCVAVKNSDLNFY